MSYSRKLKNNFFFHSVPVMLGIFLSTLALILTIPVTMIGLSEQRSLYSLAQSGNVDFFTNPNNINNKLTLFTLDKDGRCVYCPDNPRAGMPCVAVDKRLCKNLTPSVTPPNNTGGGDWTMFENDKLSYNINSQTNYIHWDVVRTAGKYVLRGGSAHSTPTHRTINNFSGVATLDLTNGSVNFNQLRIGYVQNVNRGIADVYVDGEKIGEVNSYGSFIADYRQITPWQSNTFSCGKHKVEIKATGRGAGKDKYFTLDYVDVKPCAQGLTPTPTVSVSPVPGGESTLQLVPASSQVSTNGEFFATAQITTGNNQVTAVEGRVNFNSEYFSVLDVTPLGDFTVKITDPVINNENGFAKFIYGVTPGSQVKGSNLNVAVVKFKAKNKTGQQTISFGPNHTKVSALGYSENVLKETFSMTVNVTTGNYLLGDLNKDGKVYIEDVTILVNSLGNTDCGNTADLNGDCRVNIFDYNILLQNFGKGISPTPTPTSFSAKSPTPTEKTTYLGCGTDTCREMVCPRGQVCADICGGKSAYGFYCPGGAPMVRKWAAKCNKNNQCINVVCEDWSNKCNNECQTNEDCQ